MTDFGGVILNPLLTLKSKIEHHLGTFPCPFVWVFPIFFNLHVKKICRSGKKVALKNSVVAQKKFSFVEK